MGLILQLFVMRVFVVGLVVYQGVDSSFPFKLTLAQNVGPNCFGMTFLLLRRLSNSLLILVDAVDDFRIVVCDAKHFRGLVARHSELLYQQNQL